MKRREYSRCREAVNHSPDGHGVADAAGPESMAADDAGRDDAKEPESPARDVRDKSVLLQEISSKRGRWAFI